MSNAPAPVVVAQSGPSSVGGSAATSPISPAFASSNYAKENGSMTTVGDEMWSDAQEMAEMDEEAAQTRREIEEIGDVNNIDGRSIHAAERVPSASEHKDYSGVIKPEGKNRAESIIIERPPSAMASQEESPSQAEGAAVSPPAIAPVNLTPPTASVRNTSDSGQTLEVPASVSTASPSPAVSHHSTASLERRPSRRRSTVESRAANRFSGFFSQLIHRRPDRELLTSASQPSIVPEESNHAKAEGTSRASSPASPRSVTPPPSLPPPSLQELGLSLTAITGILTPSHFSTPPTSGTFLSPHFLLLCHSQGLDVLPLVSPPAPQPYALVRRVSFKSVVVMEERGVLVAIAGRRDGVRVYALEEVRKAVEWRIDVEVRRERERLRREEAKKGIVGGVDKVFGELKVSKGYNERYIKAKLDSPTTPTPPTPTPKPKRRKSAGALADSSAVTPPARPRPRPPTIGRRSLSSTAREPLASSQHDSDPPPYQNPSPTRPPLRNQSSVISVTQTRSRTGSIADVLAGTTARRRSALTSPRDDEKADWEHGSSDDEAINMATAGPSGSAALDERTSSLANAVSNSSGIIPSSSSGGAPSSPAIEVPNIEDSLRRSQTSTSLATLHRRGRPAQLDLSNNSNTSIRPPPSPTPTIWTLRQALQAVPPDEERPNTATSEADNDEDEDEEGRGESITFAQALLESRIPDLPPPGTRRPQEAILIGSHSNSTDEPQSPRDTNSEIHTVRSDVHTPTPSASRRSRRRWSVFDGVFNSGSNGSIESASINSRPSTAGGNAPRSSNITDSQMSERSSNMLTRISSADATSVTQRPSTAHGHTPTRTPSRASTAHTAPALAPVLPQSTSTSSTSSHHRFLPRILTNAFSSRRSEEQLGILKSSHSDLTKKQTSSALPPVPPAPKLEYVKLPGTKGAVTIKAVETAKKSFLAILCGENGEKVELFAGTYRTTLGLSRTFILPDSPRSLELQLQGDDLVEVFLVFAQNVFGLEPATVRVREVRVGRAERRAARRRARDRVEELVSTEADAPTLGDDDANGGNNNPVGVTFSTAGTSGNVEEAAPSPPPMSRHTSDSNINGSTPGPSQTTSTGTPDAQSDELAVIAAAQLAPYTTFQQLSFAPNFPLATIADECIIPPTYQSFLEYRAQYEPEENGANNLDLANVQFSPPGLPVPPVLPPSKWYYRDPKGVIQGPWKASLMQTWYKDGLLPPDLPVRREEDLEFMLLKDLRAHSVDPTHPFRSLPPPLDCVTTINENAKPLLEPISLLTQPRHYGPPALFFTTRGGHSTSIVDSRGRSVLKGRFQWSVDDEENFSFYGGRLGDVKRLEAFDIQDKAVIVAVRQGGLEVTEVGDALMRPGDLSRTHMPHFQPAPSNTSRREPYVWRIGSPLSHFASGPISSSPPSLPQTPSKKQHLGIGKSPAKSDYALGVSDDYESRYNEELLFLGRNDDNVYFCERSNGSFRILRLCPYPVSS